MSGSLFLSAIITIIAVKEPKTSDKLSMETEDHAVLPIE